MAERQSMVGGPAMAGVSRELMVLKENKYLESACGD